MTRDEILEQFKLYVSHTKRIRYLSTPNTDGISDADKYADALLDNFTEIGELAGKNKKILNDFVKPVLSGEEELTDENRELLAKFTELLTDDETFEEVDIHLAGVINNFLFENENKSALPEDDNAKVTAMFKKVRQDYLMLSVLSRYDTDELTKVREKALNNRNELSSYLDKDKFKALNEEAKGNVLLGSLTGALLYESNIYPMPDEWWEKALSILDDAENILKDPFFREMCPEYEWNAYEFRIYYYGSFFAYSYIPKHVAKRVYEYALKAIDFLKKCNNESITSVVDIKQEEDLLYMATVLAGLVSPREACERFYKAYEDRDTSDYSIIGVNKNLDTPSLYLSLVKMTNLELTEADYDRYREIEKASLKYIYNIPKKSDVYMKCVTLFSNFPIYYKEVPGNKTIKEFCIDAFAAIHPPTYIHCNMVARLAECIARHLLDIAPQVFLGFPGCEKIEQVADKKDDIIRYTYNASLCHDMGKLIIIDTISMYGRNLLDDEFSIIKSHPVTGAKIASQHQSTKDYVDVIRGHHVWYDCTNGYPKNFNTFESPYKTIIDIVSIADSIDAATDAVGRSYSKKKTLSDLKAELIECAGTRYAPFVIDIFEDEDTQKDIEYLLDEGRKRLYSETYIRLQ